MNKPVAPSHPVDAAIHHDAVKASAEFDAKLRSKGYRHEAIKSSATVEHRYTKGDHEISISGHHGTGHYGVGKSIHSLHDSKHGFNAVHDIGDHHMVNKPHGQFWSDAAPKAHRELISKIHSHIDSIK